MQLTLVSGRPISFLMDLYEPLFMARPFVTPEQHASLRPRVYDQDLASRDREFEAAGDPLASRRDATGGSVGGMMGGMGGGFLAAAPASRRSSGPSCNQRASGCRPGRRSQARRGRRGHCRRRRRAVPLRDQTAGDARPQRIGHAADRQRRGEREKVAIYNPAVHAKHPLAGLRLTNTTPLHLLQGPITLFDGGEYAGDARIEDIPPGSTRLVSYALDLETEVAVEDKPAEQVLVALSIRQGGLHVKHKATRRTQYVVKNSSDRAKQCSSTAHRPGVESRSARCDRDDAGPAPAGIQAEPGKTATLLVTEERQEVDDFALFMLEPSQLELYLHMQAASPAVVKAVQEVLDRKTAAAAIQANRLAAETFIAELAAEQERAAPEPASPSRNSNR